MTILRYVSLMFSWCLVLFLNQSAAIANYLFKLIQSLATERTLYIEKKKEKRRTFSLSNEVCRLTT